MGNYNTKTEEVILTQNAAAGDNNSEIQQIRQHLGITNYVGLCILLLILGFTSYWIFRTYKRCHERWMVNQINRHALRRSVLFYRRGPSDEENRKERVENV